MTDPATSPDAAADTAAETTEAPVATETGTRPQDPPVLIAATVGEVTAIWQVEVDARVVLGEFSGAWLVDADGIRGFAADADWIHRRDSREDMLALILARPVIVVGEDGAPLAGDDARNSFSLPAGTADTLQIVDVAATVAQAAGAVEVNKVSFAEANPGKRQPGWGAAWADADFTPLPGRAPGGFTADEDRDAGEAVVRALAGARGLRGLVQNWNALDKLRVQRIGGDLRALPLVVN
ncbi:N-acetylglucosamine-6-phosphate deacetylase [uncultured Corynebacterium sp.]|uniref:N-acetylglucosamine-6-phosphate deacetylase n=1 Tax=uncultured Corynebacterium sp. TaxID=159447 RepID=UPI0025E7319D|nr:N-acetylglucosamine-6-phosphate deacetylase [uncultured Corynebacterium sp.]